MSSNGKKFVVLLLTFLVLLSSCKKKKPTVPQPQSQAPTITQPQPQAQPQPQQQPQPEPQPPAAATTTPPQKSTAKTPKSTPRKRHVAKKPVPSSPDKGKNTVKEGGENVQGGQLSAGIPQDEATRQRQSAAQLRQTAENNLKSITRQLSLDEQAMVQQIRTYLAQSRSADNDGDIERSYNLAFKAHLLSGELIKR